AAQSFKLLGRCDLRNLTVRSYAHGRVVDERNRNECGNALGQRRFSNPESIRGWKTVGLCWRRDELRFVCHHKIKAHVYIQPQSWLLSFQLRPCLLEQLTIQIETHRHNVAALRGAQNAAGTANLEIAHGDAKTSA